MKKTDNKIIHFPHCVMFATSGRVPKIATTRYLGPVSSGDRRKTGAEAEKSIGVFLAISKYSVLHLLS